MEEMSRDAVNRRLTHLSAFTALGISLAVLAIVQICLPPSALQVSQHVSGYAAFTALAGAAGFYGASNRHATLIAIFANYLLLDVVVFTVPRFMFAAYTLALPHTLCSLPSGSMASNPDFRMRMGASGMTMNYERQLVRLEQLEHWAKQEALADRDRCLVFSWTLVGGLVISLIALTFMEGTAALRIRRWAKDLLREQDAKALEHGWQVQEKRALADAYVRRATTVAA